MNAKQQAQNGFKTFIVTFLGSLVIFGSFYYFLMEASTEDVNVEDSSTLMGETRTAENDTMPTQALEASEVTNETEDVKGAAVAGDSPFAQLSAQNVYTAQGAVLSGTDQTTQSTVPSTGFTSITMGLVISVALFSFFMYIVFINPRRYALSKFEENVMRDLEK